MCVCVCVCVHTQAGHQVDKQICVCVCVCVCGVPSCKGRVRVERYFFFIFFTCLGGPQGVQADWIKAKGLFLVCVQGSGFRRGLGFGV